MRWRPAVYVSMDGPLLQIRMGRVQVGWDETRGQWYIKKAKI